MKLYPDNEFEQMDDEQADRFLHTHILRQPWLCYTKLHQWNPPWKQKEWEVLTEEERENQLRRLHYYRCPKCSYRLAVSEYALEMNTLAHDQILPDCHPQPVPPYVCEEEYIWKLLEHIAERDTHYDPLQRELLALLGATAQEISYVNKNVLGLFKRGGEGKTPRQLGEAIWKAYRTVQEKDWGDHHENQRPILWSLSRRRTREGIPLFARIGHIQEKLTQWDFPYVFYPPSSGIPIFQGIVLVCECNNFEARYFSEPPPKEVRVMQEILKDYHVRVSEPRSFTWNRHQHFWGIDVDIS